MNKFLILAAAQTMSGQDMIKGLGLLLVIGICLLIIWLMGRYFFPKLSAPPVVIQIWDGLFVLIGGFVLINLILSIAGYPIVKW
jgi:hypothetical protein